jgi:dihydroxyacetone synthase
MTAANGVTNGVSHPVQQKSTDYGHEAVDKILDKTVQNDTQSKHPRVLQTFRLLIADLCQQFGGGHPG